VEFAIFNRWGQEFTTFDSVNEAFEKLRVIGDEENAQMKHLLKSDLYRINEWRMLLILFCTVHMPYAFYLL
jgi:hypothetical protein